HQRPLQRHSKRINRYFAKTFDLWFGGFVWDFPRVISYHSREGQSNSLVEIDESYSCQPHLAISKYLNRKSLHSFSAFFVRARASSTAFWHWAHFRVAYLDKCQIL